jgi:hypothetical protein
MCRFIKLDAEMYTKTEALANTRGSITLVDYCKITVGSLGGIRSTV